MSDDGLLLAEVVIQRVIVGDEDNVTVETRDSSGETPSLIELLGMLRLAEDTVIRQAMGEVPEEDDDE